MPHLLLITGGAGFIGSNFVRWLHNNQPDAKIVILDALTYAGNLANLENLPVTRDPERFPESSSILFVHGDICNVTVVEKLFQRHGFTGVFNFAAESHVDRSILGAQPFLSTNILGTQTLLDAARSYGNPLFVQISTDEVYGSLGPQGQFTEETPIAPNSAYSASKASADLLIHAAQHTFGQRALITRCSNNYGSYQHPEKLIPLMITHALADKPLPVYGDGLQIRNWLHVDDHCAGAWAAFTKGKPGQVYNFGGQSECANVDLVKRLLKLAGKPESLIHHVTDRPGHDRRYSVDFSKSARELDWRPQVEFDKGLAQTFQWYLDHKSWWAGK